MVDLLYIEDDPDIGRAVKEYLEQKEFRVTICGTLAQARQMLNRHVPTLVLLDWNMPDGRGDSLCRWIRGSRKELPIIFLTVRGDARDIVSGFQSGADDYVVKPFELEV
ncbi:MAG: response regulator, partial [Desulfovibrionaceae bacterium]|nr:response regulator [Desulfovibrionaceae bacterium]